MAKKKQDSGGGANDWLNTYADMVTLLMTFFVMLFSSASIEESKWEQLVESFIPTGDKNTPSIIIPGDGDDKEGNQTGQDETESTVPETDTLPTDINELYEYIKKYVEESDQSGSIEVEKSGDNVFLRLTDNIFFSPNKSDLKQVGIDVLDIIGGAVKNMEESISLININGHTASVENYSTTVDRTLSSNRANSVLVYLEDQKGFDPRKLMSIGFGRNYPVAPNNVEEEKRKNRRVDILIMGQNSEYNELLNIQQIIGGVFDNDEIPTQ
ncbi:MAG: OmpA/MotB family protein [Oscillospiraceae bacterium]